MVYAIIYYGDYFGVTKYLFSTKEKAELFMKGHYGEDIVDFKNDKEGNPREYQIEIMLVI